MNKEVKLDVMNIPEKEAKAVIERFLPLVEKYHRQQMIEFKVPDFKNDFGIKELCLSCYTQGLLDAEQLKKQSK